MEIQRVERHSVDELVANLRRVGMFTDPEARVYENSVIELTSFHTNEIAPAQRYVLASEITKVRDLKWALAEHGCGPVQARWLRDYLAGGLRRSDRRSAAGYRAVRGGRRQRSEDPQRRHAPGLPRADGALPDPGGLRPQRAGAVSVLRIPARERLERCCRSCRTCPRAT